MFCLVTTQADPCPHRLPQSIKRFLKNKTIQPQGRSSCLRLSLLCPLLPSLPGSWLKVTDYIAEKNLPVFQPGVKVG